MLIVSYDISSDKLRTRFLKFLVKCGAIRLQYSVYEINNTKRVKDTICVKVETYFSKKFDGGDSIFIFEADIKKAIKYGNAIHRDMDLLFFD